MHPPSGETLTLRAENREKAKSILEDIEAGEVESPADIVDSWSLPETTIDSEMKDYSFSRDEGFVSPELIKGSATSENRLETGRLEAVLFYMLNGDFEIRESYPPVLQKREDRYFVITDGHHRCMAAKAIGLERLYVEYEEVPPEILVD